MKKQKLIICSQMQTCMLGGEMARKASLLTDAQDEERAQFCAPASVEAPNQWSDERKLEQG